MTKDRRAGRHNVTDNCCVTKHSSNSSPGDMALAAIKPKSLTYQCQGQKCQSVIFSCSRLHISAVVYVCISGSYSTVPSTFSDTFVCTNTLSQAKAAVAIQ